MKGSVAIRMIFMILVADAVCCALRDVVANAVAGIEHTDGVNHKTTSCKTITIRIQVPIDEMKKMMKKKDTDVTQNQAKVIDKTCDDSFFENQSYHNDDMRAVAAAAIMTTYRGTYAFKANTNNASIESSLTMKLFEMDIRTDIQ